MFLAQRVEPRDVGEIELRDVRNRRPRRAQVLGGLSADRPHRLPLHRAPAGEIGKRDRAATCAARSSGALHQPLRVRLDVLDGNTSARSAARHFADLDAKLARHAPHGRRCRYGRQFRCRRFQGRPRTARDVDDVGGARRGLVGGGLWPDPRILDAHLAARRALLTGEVLLHVTVRRRRRRVGARRFVSARTRPGSLPRGIRRGLRLCRRRFHRAGFRCGCGAIFLDAQDHLAHLDLVARLDLDLLHHPGER